MRTKENEDPANEKDNPNELTTRRQRSTEETAIPGNVEVVADGCSFDDVRVRRQSQGWWPYIHQQQNQRKSGSYAK